MNFTLSLTVQDSPLIEVARVGIRAGPRTLCLGANRMKKMSFVLAAAGLMTLAACNKPAENAAENAADNVEAAADNLSDVAENIADNASEATTNAVEATANAIDNAAANTANAL